jgi:hypothetical protein
MVLVVWLVLLGCLQLLLALAEPSRQRHNALLQLGCGTTETTRIFVTNSLFSRLPVLLLGGQQAGQQVSPGDEELHAALRRRNEGATGGHGWICSSLAPGRKR